MKVKNFDATVTVPRFWMPGRYAQFSGESAVLSINNDVVKLDEDLLPLMVEGAVLKISTAANDLSGLVAGTELKDGSLFFNLTGACWQGPWNGFAGDYDGFQWHADLDPQHPVESSFDLKTWGGVRRFRAAYEAAAEMAGIRPYIGFGGLKFSAVLREVGHFKANRPVVFTAGDARGWK